MLQAKPWTYTPLILSHLISSLDSNRQDLVTSYFFLPSLLLPGPLDCTLSGPLTACSPWSSESESLILNIIESFSAPNSVLALPLRGQATFLAFKGCGIPVPAPTQTSVTTGPSPSLLWSSCLLIVASDVPPSERSSPAPTVDALRLLLSEQRTALSSERPPGTTQLPHPRSRLLPNQKHGCMKAWPSHPKLEQPSRVTPSQNCPQDGLRSLWSRHHSSAAPSVPSCFLPSPPSGRCGTNHLTGQAAASGRMALF